MQEALAQLINYAWGIWRFRWPGIAAAWLLALVGWVGVYQLPDSYVASARIYVDSNTVLGPLLKGLAIQPNIGQRIGLMSRTLLSRPNLEKLMRMADLDLEVASELEEEQYLTELRESISLSGDRNNTSLYSLSYKNEDRDTAKRIVQALITVFIESSLGDKREDSTDAQSFLDMQIAEYETRLIEAEQRLAEFKQKYSGILPGASGGYYKRLAQAKGQQEEASLMLRELQNRRNELKRQLSGQEPVFLPDGGETVRVTNSALDARIEKLEANRDALLARYTNKHPEVVQINMAIKDLIAQNEAERAANNGLSNADYTSLTSSPAYQDMRTMLAETEARLAELTVRVAEYDNRVEELEDKVNNIPLIETELKQLDRDYGVIAKKHADLLSRREAAMISQKVEQNANDVTFRVVDPPFVPLKPSEPNKLLLNFGVLFAAIGAGFGVALLLSLLRPVYMDHRMLTLDTGLPMLGTVSTISNSEQRKMAIVNAAMFGIASGSLLLVFVGVAVVQQGILAI